jgi:hypothetical protein
MIQEFKVMTSNFSAENSKGPVVLNSIAKSGGRDYHGEAYLYARHYSMNSQDFENNKLGLPKPENKYYFPGAQIGGPVLIPGTNFNKNRDKLFFFTAFEYYKQTLDTGLVTSNVPSAAERIGDFSGDLASLQSAATGGNTAAQAFVKNYPTGVIPAGSVDPSGKGLAALYPLPNANPAVTQGFNFAKQYNVNQNSYQSLSRIDYSISDNTKLFVRYNLQNELQQFPIGLWWRNTGQVPYPTPIDAHNTSQSVSASLTHVFNPTLTNEAVVGYTYINFPNSFEDAKKVDRTALGIPFTGIYHNGVAQIPSVTSWGAGIGAIFNPGGFEKGNGTLFATKYLPSFSDTLTKVAGTHTLKFGYYWEHVINNQPANNYTNGLIIEAPWAGGSTGNTYADLLLGNAAQYQESNKNPLHNEGYTIHEAFVQDSWKATRRLTLELGLRASHLGNWYDRGGVGFAVYAPSTYTNTPTAPTNYDGILWHAKDSSIPLSGYNQKSLFWAPRFGLAYDVFGTGKTVVRGGWGAFRYHTPQFTNGLDVGYGVLNYNQGSLLSFSQLQQLSGASATTGRQSLSALDRNSSEQPLTYSWSFTISQRTFGHSLFEASYVGNSSQYLPDSGGTFNNVNAVPYGTFLGNGNVSSDAYDAARPLINYQDLNVARNNLYANYHSLQLSWVRQSGRWNYQVNYTFGKALGITGNANQLNINDNYGPTANDRRHTFNAAYSYEVPNLVRGDSKALRVLGNGWQISGITQFSTGQNLEQNGNQSFNLQSGDYLPNFSSTYINGTNSVALHPLLTCDPSKNLKANQYINGDCFAAPSPGHNGPTVLPEVFGPSFIDSDLSLFKNVQFSESRRLQLRVSAYNFLNHPLNSFIDQGANNLTLQLGANGKNENKNFGYTSDKYGHRTIQLAVKFYF